MGLCLCLCATGAHAQTADDLKAARTHFDAATRAFRAGDFAGACRDFQRAYELSQKADLLYNLGRCPAYRRRHRPATQPMGTSGVSQHVVPALQGLPGCTHVG